MPFPEQKPSTKLLEVLAEAKSDAEIFQALYDKIQPHIHAWMTKSFPGCKIFDNRVQSLTCLVCVLVREAMTKAEGDDNG